MCVAAAVPIMMGLATAVSAIGQIQQGEAAKAQGEYNAKVAENNATVQKYQAEDAARRGSIAEDAQRNRTRQVIGAQRAAMAANGGDLTDQSSINILTDTARYGELDALTVRSNAAREAWGFDVGANDSLAQATASRFAGKNAARNAMFGAAGTLLSGGASAYRQFKIS